MLKIFSGLLNWIIKWYFHVLNGKVLFKGLFNIVVDIDYFEMCIFVLHAMKVIS